MSRKKGGKAKLSTMDRQMDRQTGSLLSIQQNSITKTALKQAAGAEPLLSLSESALCVNYSTLLFPTKYLKNAKFVLQKHYNTSFYKNKEKIRGMKL